VLITERAVQRIVVDLEREGYLRRERVGRQNHYRLDPLLHLRHPLEHHVEVGRLLALLQTGTAVSGRRRNAPRSRGGAKTVSRLKKTPRKSRKLMAKKSV
jgi:hypothetical protein